VCVLVVTSLIQGHFSGFQWFVDHRLPLERLGSAEHLAVHTVKVTLKNARGEVTARPGYFVAAKSQ
jgi:hypothetical protein